MSAIFGGSKSKQKSQSTQSSTSTQSSQSGNLAYPALSQAYMPAVKQGNDALGLVGSLLGMGGGDAGAKAFDTYRNSTDYDFTLQQGQQAVNTNQATAGALGSGKTLKALQTFGQNTAQKYLGDYIARLLGINTAGLNAGQLIAGTGQQSSSQGISTSTGQSTSSGTSGSSPGIGGFLGSVIGGIARG